MSPIVEVKDFSFKYRDTKRRAVKHVDFQVEEGSFFTIIGANGAGKSTLCNALVGLIPHYFVGPEMCIRDRSETVTVTVTMPTADTSAADANAADTKEGEAR